MKWRRNTKIKVINSFGGSCGVCGYAVCKDALELHHLDPSKKEFTLAEAIANGAGRKKLFPELEKCVLMCSNHHKEVHAGLRTVPEDMPRFNPDLYEMADTHGFAP